MIAETDNILGLLRAGALKLAGSTKAADTRTARRDAELILAHVLDVDVATLVCRAEPPSPTERHLFCKLIDRRLLGEPVAYITGEQAFWSLDFHVDESTLIPRPDTETLVEVGLGALKGIRSPEIADLGTGSGCILLSIAAELSDLRGIGLDRSPRALNVARKNAQRHGLADRVQFLESDWLTALEKQERFDLIVSNPPYIRRADLQTLMPDVRDFEPASALDGGEDGLDCYRMIIKQSMDYLMPGAALAVEVAHDQASDVGAIFQENGYADISFHRDLAAIERVVSAKKPPKS